MKGKLVIISAPSGAGKTTIVRHLLQNEPDLSFSVSATTRQVRCVEKEGEDYYFLSVSEFRKKIEKNEFVEWQEVYKDCFYGTLKSELERIWTNGKSVLFDVDAMGGINLKKKFGTNSVSIFIMPPSIEELETRLMRRGTDNTEKIRMRVKKSKEEVKLAENFDHIVVNKHLESAKKEVLEIVRFFLAEKH
jgi:guanylate kinase